jgi:hypothetical protein
MTKLISILVIAVLLFGAWELFLYWDKVQHEQEAEQKRAEAEQVVPEQLPGMVSQLEPSLQAAKSQGAAAMKNWLKIYGPSLRDPRKAWIQLDYCLLLSRENPAGARRLFAEIKNRTPESSPVWRRIKQLEKTYE